MHEILSLLNVIFTLAAYNLPVEAATLVKDSSDGSLYRCKEPYESMTDAFILNELAVAPNPLGLAPNLKLVTISVDACISFELWLPKPDTALLPEEARLLVGDRPRLEEICATLTRLFGAVLIGQDGYDDPTPTHDWRVVQHCLYRMGTQFDAVGVNYQLHAFYSGCADSSRVYEAVSTARRLKPIWDVSFFDFKPLGNKYQIATRSIGLLITDGNRLTQATRTTIAGLNQA